jgi:glutamyl-Q tRNA(Asp) synthetase
MFCDAESPDLVGRFAPSPNGRLHLGHAFAAIQCVDILGKVGGKLILRLEDLDAARCRPAFAQAIIDDLRWLGIAWDALIVQSQRLNHYADALARLAGEGLAYRCFCSRRQVAAAAKRTGPDGPAYSGHCRGFDAGAAAQRAQTEPHGWRFDHRAALARFSGLYWTDLAGERHALAPGHLDDILLASRHLPATYHLAVVVDDAAQAISHVVRGADLLRATDIQRLVQAALGLPSPRYHHHELILDNGRQKLAKSRASASLLALRERGVDGQLLAAQLRARKLPLGLSLGWPT